MSMLVEAHPHAETVSRSAFFVWTRLLSTETQIIGQIIGHFHPRQEADTLTGSCKVPKKVSGGHRLWVKKISHF